MGSPGDQEHLGVWTTERRFSASDMRTDLAVLAPGASLVFAAWAHVVDFCGLVDAPTVAKRAELVQKLAASIALDPEAASYPKPREHEHPFVPCAKAAGAAESPANEAEVKGLAEEGAGTEQEGAGEQANEDMASNDLLPHVGSGPLKPISRRGVSRVATPGLVTPSALAAPLPGAPSRSPKAFGPLFQRQIVVGATAEAMEAEKGDASEAPTAGCDSTRATSSTATATLGAALLSDPAVGSQIVLVEGDSEAEANSRDETPDNVADVENALAVRKKRKVLPLLRDEDAPTENVRKLRPRRRR